MSRLKKILIIILFLIITFVIVYSYLSIRKTPEKIQYGMSFNTLYATELGLDWKEVYDAILKDLKIKHFRLAVHWNLIEPQDDQWDFSAIDYQIEEAQKHNADIILAIGRRLPRWPECHVPDWAKDMTWDEQKKEIRDYLKVIVDRYKKYDNIKYWQVENEPFLEVFATEHCGNLDVDFLDEEIALVKSLDNSRPILVTDSGNLGTWASPYRRGDSFGTSVYVYLWNEKIGPFKSFLPPSFYRVKTSLMEQLFGKKESMLIELSAEPWLLQPVVDTNIDVQLERMNLEKINGIIDFAKKTKFEKQYLWGAEWWYYMSQYGHPEFWQRAKELFGD